MGRCSYRIHGNVQCTWTVFHPSYASCNLLCSVVAADKGDVIRSGVWLQRHGAFLLHLFRCCDSAVGEDPLFKMNAYTSYLASKRGSARSIWSRIYKDEFGIGDVVTAAKPIYSPKTSFGEDGSFVGVVGHDVRIEDFEAVVPEFLVAIRRFIFRGIQCIDTVFTGCELQVQSCESH